MSSFRRQTASVTRASVCVINKTARYREQTALCALLNRSCGCQTLINLRRAASSRTQLVLQAYCLTDVDEINPLGIEIWYRTTRRFSILGGIEAIRSVPKKYRTRYPALVAMDHKTQGLDHTMDLESRSGLGLGDISHAICMRISSVKPVS